MALALYDRVQETTTTTGTGTITLAGAVAGFQSFAVVGNGNTTYYCITSNNAWEVGIGTYTASGTTLARTTVLSNSSGTTSPISLTGTSNVFVTYPSERSVNLDASGNVSALGTIASGTWNGATIGVAYGGTGVTTSSGANSVMIRDANQNVSINRLNQQTTTVTAAAGTTTLTVASTFSWVLNGTGGQTFKLPDATTLTATTAFEFNNNATGTLTIIDNANATVGTVASGGAASIALLTNSTVAGLWDVHAYIPENVTWGTNALNLSTTVITGGTWNGGTITSGYGGTGLTTFTAANNALYSTSAGALAAGTLPVAAGGTGLTSLTAGRIPYGNGTSPFSSSSSFVFDGLNLGVGSSLNSWSGVNALQVSSRASLYSTGTNTVLGYNFYYNGSSSIYASTGYATSYVQTSGTHQWLYGTGGGSGGTVTFIEAMRITNNGGLAFNGSTNYGTSGQVLTSAGDAPPTWTTISGGGTPAGSNTQIQYNNSGSFGASSNLVFDGMNLGVGALSAWSGVKALQIYTNGALYSSGANIILGNNFYYNGSNNVYVNTGYATSYAQTNAGEHQWYAATGGGSGTTASFNQIMTLNNSGNLGIGTTSPRFKLSVGDTTATSTATPDTIDLGATYSSTVGANGKIRVWYDGSNYMGFGVSANQLDYINTGGYSHVFYTNSAEKMRITATGALAFGGSANYGTAGQVLTSAGSGSVPTWTTVAGGSTGPIVQNTTAITSNQSLTAGYNGQSVGPISINAGFSVTIAAGQAWQIS